MAYRYLIGALKHTKCFLLRFDGNTKPNPGIATSGLMLYSPFHKNQRVPLVESGIYHGDQIFSSNDSEYLALKSGLSLALKYGVYDLIVEGDSSSVIKGILEGSGKQPQQISEEIEELLPVFDTLAFRYIPRKENKEADHAAREAFEAKATFENNLVNWSVENPYGLSPKSKKRIKEQDTDEPVKKRSKRCDDTIDGN